MKAPNLELWDRWILFLSFPLRYFDFNFGCRYFPTNFGIHESPILLRFFRPVVNLNLNFDWRYFHFDFGIHEFLDLLFIVMENFSVLL